MLCVLCFQVAAIGAPLSRCQCEYDKWVGTCGATIMNENGFAKITSHTNQCSRVDWYIDGNPQMTIVTNGLSTEPLLNVKPGSKLVIQACNVCTDAMIPGGTGAASSGAMSGSKPSKIVTNSDLSGVWRGTLEGSNAGPMIVRLSVNADAISGSMEMGGSNFNIVSGTVSADTISWRQSFVMGDVRWTGTIDRSRGSIRGTWKHPFNSDTFEVTKE